MIFIICFYRSFYEKLSFRNYAADKVWQSAAVTIVAQAGTLPLTISLFNRFPAWFLLTNIIIVPLSSIVVIIGCLIPLTYPILFISRLLASLMDKLTGITELLTAKAASMPLASIENIGMISLESFLFFVFVFLFSLSALNRKKVPLSIPLTALMVFALAGSIRSISDRVSGELIVYNGINESQLAIRTGRTLNLWSGSDTIFPEAARHGMTRRLKVKVMHPMQDPLLIESQGKRILVCNYLSEALQEKTHPDIVVFMSKSPWIDRNISPGKMPEAIILGSEVSSGLRITARQRERCTTIHDTGVSGAFRKRL